MRLFVATPMYGGVCAGVFARSMMELSTRCMGEGITLATHFMFNESLITRARNYCVDYFLRSDCTHLMFIDSDITFDPLEVIQLLILARDGTPYDVIGGAYPKKNISWEKVKAAVDKGVADEDPNELANFVGDYVMNPAPGSPEKVPLGEPVEVLEIGTGFMMIRRSVLEKYKEFYPNIMYRPDHARSGDFDGNREIGMYFQADIDPLGNTKRYLSEDYWFCQHVRNMGGKVWLCPWMHLEHTGTYTFGGSIGHISSIGLPPTIDPAVIDARRKRDKEKEKK